MVKKTVCLLLAGLLFSGCSLYRIDSQDTTLDFYPPKASAKDIVYLELVDKPYEVIGMVSVTTERTHSLEEILAKMKEEAAILGGDAITDLKTGADGAAQPIKLFENAYLRARYSAKVLILK